VRGWKDHVLGGFGYADLEERVPVWPDDEIPHRQHFQTADGDGLDATGGGWGSSISMRL